jgi:hypothetical protein
MKVIQFYLKILFEIDFSIGFRLFLLFFECRQNKKIFVDTNRAKSKQIALFNMISFDLIHFFIINEYQI